MSVPRRDQREQEVSIRQREGELFHDEVEVASTTAKPFAEYLRETPAAPLTTWVKAVLWATGVVVALLLVAALWRLQSKSAPQARGGARSKQSSRFEPSPSVSPFRLGSLCVANLDRSAPTNPESP